MNIIIEEQNEMQMNSKEMIDGSLHDLTQLVV